MPIVETDPTPPREPRPAAAPTGRGPDPRGPRRRPNSGRRRDPATFLAPAPNPTVVLLKDIWSWVALFGVVIIVGLLIKALIVQAFFIPSGSMENTLLVNDRVLVNKLSYKYGDIQRGDIIVFHAPPVEREANPDIDVLIKRVIGLPGDTITSDNGVVSINGTPLKEPYIANPQDTGDDIAEGVIPVGSYFMMGDNRGNSQDSRYFGPIDEHTVIGKCVLRLWPPWKLTLF